MPSRRSVLAAIAGSVPIASAGCLSTSGTQSECKTVTNDPNDPDGNPTGCADPANATVDFSQSTTDDSITVSVTLRSLTNADKLVLTTDYDDEFYTLSEVGQSKTLTGFDQNGQVVASVPSCGSSRAIDVHYVSRPECSS
jgi:hypothetical protein